LTGHVVIYDYYVFSSNLAERRSWHSSSRSRLKLTSMLLLILSATPIDGKHLLPSVGELDSHTRVYYGIVTDGGFCKERWQHCYDMGSSYL